MPNRQPPCNTSPRHAGPTCTLFVVALGLGVVSLSPPPNLYAAESPLGEAADDNSSAQKDQSEADDSDANASETNDASWSAEWITGDESIAVTLLPGDGLTLRLQESGGDVPLPDDASGRLRFADPADSNGSTPPSTLSPLRQHRARIETRRKAAMRGAWSPDQEGHRGPPDENAWQNAIHLRGGDVVDGRVISVGPKGVQFRSSRHGTATISHDRVEQLELDLLEDPTAAALDEPTRKRLSTVPRMQADAPPTQILVSPSGDYLRGRLTSLDDTRVAVTMHGGSAEIPRDHVARIVWLHPDPDEKIDSAQAPAAQSPATDSSATVFPAFRFRLTRWDGERLTLTGLRVEADHLIGHHESFGECRFELADLTEIAVGGTLISQPDPTIEPWRAIPATLPIADQQDADDP